jgi:hypothetical protein
MSFNLVITFLMPLIKFAFVLETRENAPTLRFFASGRTSLGLHVEMHPRLQAQLRQAVNSSLTCAIRDIGSTPYVVRSGLFLSLCRYSVVRFVVIIAIAILDIVLFLISLFVVGVFNASPVFVTQRNATQLY